jgi:hypothetical protein
MCFLSGNVGQAASKTENSAVPARSGNTPSIADISRYFSKEHGHNTAGQKSDQIPLQDARTPPRSAEPQSVPLPTLQQIRSRFREPARRGSRSTAAPSISTARYSWSELGPRHHVRLRQAGRPPRIEPPGIIPSFPGPENCVQKIAQESGPSNRSPCNRVINADIDRRFPGQPCIRERNQEEAHQAASAAEANKTPPGRETKCATSLFQNAPNHLSIPARGDSICGDGRALGGVLISRRDMATQTSPGSALLQDKSTENHLGLPFKECRESILDRNPGRHRLLSGLDYRDNGSVLRDSERMTLSGGAFRQQLSFTDELLSTPHILPSEIYSQGLAAQDFSVGLGTRNHQAGPDVPLGYGLHFNTNLGSDGPEAPDLARFIGILEGRPGDGQEIWDTPVRGLAGPDPIGRVENCQTVCRTPFLQPGGGPTRQYPVHPSLRVVDQTERPSSRQGLDHEPDAGLPGFWRPNKLY